MTKTSVSYNSFLNFKISDFALGDKSLSLIIKPGTLLDAAKRTSTSSFVSFL